MSWRASALGPPENCRLIDRCRGLVGGDEEFFLSGLWEEGSDDEANDEAVVILFNGRRDPAVPHLEEEVESGCINPICTSTTATYHQSYKISGSLITVQVQTIGV